MFTPTTQTSQKSDVLKSIRSKLTLALKALAHLISTTYSDDSHTLQCFDPLFSGSVLRRTASTDT